MIQSQRAFTNRLIIAQNTMVMRQSMKLTDKPLSNSLVANEATISVVVTFSESLIDGAQVQVDSIIQVDRTV